MSAAGHDLPRERQRLLSASSAAVFDPSELEDLPEPVQRYLTAAIVPGTPIATAATLRMHGHIKVRRWLPFRAEEVLAPHRGFVWRARAAAVISGHDAYAEGHGEMQWKLLGLATVMRAAGPDITESAAGRCGGEGLWLPTALDDMSGVPELGVAGLWLVAVLVNGLGEEAGWRGFLLPTLRSGRALVPAAARITAVWALWHLPLFWLLATYRGFSLFIAAGFLIGLGAGSVVLAHVYETTGASILAAAVWHGTYNMAAATGDDPARAAVVTALVVAWAVRIARASDHSPRADV